MNKRITSLLLSAVMLLSILVTAVPVFAAPVDNGVSASATSVSPGDTFDVTLKIPAVDTLMSNLGFKISFDTNAFEVAAYTMPTVKGASSAFATTPDEAQSNGYISAVYGGGGDNAINLREGYTLTATFRVKADAELKSYNFEWFERKMVSLNEEDGYTEYDHNPPDPVTKVAVAVVAAPVPATGISLNKNTTTIKAGQNETLTATVTPTGCTDPVTWESSDEAVATVDNTGKVTAVAKGTATITAKAGTKSATCTVTVTCDHSITDIAAKESTCTVQGWDAHKKCNTCGQLFNAAGAEISEVPFRPLKEHTGGTATCTNKPVCDVCGNEYGNLGDHNYGSLIAEVPAKCEVTGTKEHYECSVCHKLFDKNKTEVTAESLTIPALTHVPGDWQKDDTNHWKNCTTVGCGVQIASTKAAHSFEWKVDTAATEEAVGSKHEECKVCHYAKAAVEIPKLDHTHTGITKHDAVDATCKSKGNVEYWTCSSPKCAGKYYSDAACATEITTIETAVDPSNHVHTEIRDAKAATEDEEGYTGDTWCTDCNTKIATGTAIAKLTHTHSGTLVPAKEPTFTEEGNKAYYTCSCDKWFEDAACTVEITDHSSVIIPALEYAFTAGNNSSYTKGSGKDLQFTTNGAKDDCDGIKIDGILIDETNYTLESGSTIITLKNAYLETLAVDSHTITAIYGRKEITANFKIVAASAQGETTTEPDETNTPTSPKTGDNSNMILWIAMLFVSGTGVFGSTLYGKKKRNRA